MFSRDSDPHRVRDQNRRDKKDWRHARISSNQKIIRMFPLYFRVRLFRFAVSLSLSLYFFFLSAFVITISSAVDEVIHCSGGSESPAASSIRISARDFSIMISSVPLFFLLFLLSFFLSTGILMIAHHILPSRLNEGLLLLLLMPVIDDASHQFIEDAFDSMGDPSK